MLTREQYRTIADRLDSAEVRILTWIRDITRYNPHADTADLWIERDHIRQCYWLATRKWAGY